MGNRYANLIGDSTSDASISRFFGLFFMFFQMSQIWGNMISSMGDWHLQRTGQPSVDDIQVSLICSIVLSSGYGQDDNVTISEERLQFCGANFCNADTGNSTVLEKPSIDKVYMLAGIFLGFALLASAIIALFVDPLTQYVQYLWT